MFNSKKRTFSTFFAATVLLVSIAIPAFVVYAGSPPAITEIPTSCQIYAEHSTGTPLVNLTNSSTDSVAVWIGGGNNTQTVQDTLNVTTNDKFIQLDLYDTNGITGSFLNLTNAKDVLWAISDNTWLDLEAKGNNYIVKKNTGASVSRGKVTAGTIKPDNGAVYAIAYKMNFDANNRVMRFTENDSKLSSHPVNNKAESYTILAIARIEVKQAATVITAFSDAREVNAYETSTIAKTYKDGEIDVSFKKTTARTIGIGEIITLPVSGIGGIERTGDKKAIDASPDNQYTVTVEPDKRTGISYVKLVNDAGTEVNSLSLGQSGLINKVKIKGIAVAPITDRTGKTVGFNSGKATVTIKNNHSGKLTKVIITVTNGIKQTTATTGAGNPAKGIEITAPYSAVETYTFELATAKYAKTTGMNTESITALFAETTTPVYASNGPLITPDEVSQVVGVDGEGNDVIEPIPILIKPVVSVYVELDDVEYDEGVTFESVLTDAIKAASVTKPTLPRVIKPSTVSNAPDPTVFQAITGYTAKIGADNATLTFSIPKMGFLGETNKVQTIYIAAVYGSGDNNILIQKVTVTPTSPSTYNVSTTINGETKTIALAEGTIASDEYKFDGLTTGTPYVLTVTTGSFDSFTLTADTGTTISAANKSITLTKGRTTGKFKIRIGTFNYSIAVTGTDAAEPEESDESDESGETI